MATKYIPSDNSESNTHERFLDADQEPSKMLQPIEGYQHLPLVSLDEAVKPISVLCPDIHRRVYIAMSNSRNPVDGLNQNESAAIHLYTMEWEPKEQCLVYFLNKTLRSKDRQRLKPWFSYLKLILTALHKLPSHKTMIYRGVKLDLSERYQIGERFVWWAFSSCTKSLDVLESEQFLGKTGPRTLFNIRCENAKFIRFHSYVERENEMLILPATQLVVKSKLNPAPNLYIIELEQVEPPYPLIEPPSMIPSVKLTLEAQERERDVPESSRSLPISESMRDDEKLISEPTSIIDSTTAVKRSNDRSMISTGESTPDGQRKKKSLTKSLSSPATFKSTTNVENKKVESVSESLSITSTAQSTRDDKQDEEIIVESLSPISTIHSTTALKRRIGPSFTPTLQPIPDIKIEREILDQSLTISTMQLDDVLVNSSSSPQTVQMDVKNENELDVVYVETNEENPPHDDQNNEIEQKIAEYSRNSTVSLFRQGLTDSDIPFIIKRAIIEKKCSSLDIWQNQITEEGARYLGKVLQSNNTLIKLNMHVNKISNAGVRWIAEALFTNTTLIFLSLGDNAINSEGAGSLAKALQVNATLKELLLDQNSIGDIGAEYIARALIQNTSLTRLELKKNGISDKGVDHLAEMLEQNTALTHLYLTENLLTNRGVKVLMHALCKNRKLQKLWIQCSQITKECIGDIQQMFKSNDILIELGLSKKPFSAQEQEQLQTMAKTKPTRRICFNA